MNRILAIRQNRTFCRHSGADRAVCGRNPELVLRLPGSPNRFRVRLRWSRRRPGM